MSNFKNFVDLTFSIKDKELLNDFLTGVTTAREREELTHRLEIIKCLLKGDTQQNIAANLGVGVATITRGSKELSLGRFKVLRNNHK